MGLIISLGHCREIKQWVNRAHHCLQSVPTTGCMSSSLAEDWELGDTQMQKQFWVPGLGQHRSEQEAASS